MQADFQYVLEPFCTIWRHSAKNSNGFYIFTIKCYKWNILFTDTDSAVALLLMWPGCKKYEIRSLLSYEQFLVVYLLANSLVKEHTLIGKIVHSGNSLCVVFDKLENRKCWTHIGCAGTFFRKKSNGKIVFVNLKKNVYVYFFKFWIKCIVYYIF